MKKKILIVDDEKQYVDVLSSYVQQYGTFDCKACYSGKDALLEIEKAYFDCIFLDLVMPEVGGVQVLKTVQERNLETSIVVISGFLDENLVNVCKRYGASDILHKPVDIHKLKCILKRVAAI